ncbi:MAG TPA: transposase, partial [Ardenticatenaceae bacterium]|nr:transposase [Ardenticatenaceae bacterium]
MPYRTDPFAKDHYYHIYNRGAGRSLLFFGPDNYEHCLHLVKRYYQPYGAVVIAYCLMPNHYHFLLRQETDTPLSRFINVVFNSYVQAVNRQQGRSGTLFQGRFRHIRIDRDEYLLQLCRYIHRN